MAKILVILQKEWLELRQQRALILGVLLPPLIFTILPIIVVIITGQSSVQSSAHGSSVGLVSANPALEGLNPGELGQALVGIQFSNFFILLPMLIPSVVAAYSIIGEKSSRTLEPLLATPVRTWELLMGKALTALLPAIGITWVSGGIFIVSMAVFTVSSRVYNAIITPGWLITFLLWTPLLSLISIALMLIISSRVNDTRTAQQLSAWVVVPFLAVLFGQLSGLIVLGIAFTFGVALVLVLLAIVIMRIAIGLFQREVILTRWK